MARIIRCAEGFDARIFAGSSCAFGVFDGVHTGHRYLLAAACKTAQDDGEKSFALTFDRDPDELFRPDQLRKLMSNEERIDSLAATGVDAVILLPFTPDFAALPPQDFLVHTFAGTAPAHLHIGCDFRFGSQAAGTVEDLKRWGAASACEICAHELKSADGAPISATRIRSLLAACDIERANQLLGYNYAIEGTISRGRGEGSDFGFPTANLILPPQFQTLGDGVYAAYATLGGVRYRAAVSVGISPMFAEASTASCEVHLINFDGDTCGQDLYGQNLRVEFLHYLRPMTKFDSVEDLISCVQENIAWVKAHL